MDSRRLFQFRFVDRFQQKRQIYDFLDNKLQYNTLWLSGKQGIGKTRLIYEILEKQNSKRNEFLVCSFETDKGIDKLEEFIKQLQNIADLDFTDFLKTHYSSLLDISKQVTVQILKMVGLDLSGFITAAHDSATLFVSRSKQQHSAMKVIANYIDVILKNKSLIVVLDHFSACKIESVDLFMQIIGQFIGNKKIHFIISTTDEEMVERNDIRDNLLLKIPLISIILEAFDEDIYFYEILQEIFEMPNEAKSLVSQIYTICEGSPVRLQAALMELYRNNTIQLGKEKATLDFSRLRQIILQNKFGFKLEHYKISSQIILRLIISLREQVPSHLLLDAGKYIFEKMFPGMSVLTNNLAEDLANLYQFNIIDFSIDGSGVVKISNPIIRETLRERFSNDPIHRLFGQMLLSYLQENIDYILSMGITQMWIEEMIVIHSIKGQVTNWVDSALKYGLAKYKDNLFFEAIDYFYAIQKKLNDVSSENLIKIADCFFQVGKYDEAESVLQIVEGRNDYDKWLFNYYYSKIENVQLRKEHALQLAKAAVKHSKNEEERIVALNMQQQILVDTTGGKLEAKTIFDDLVARFDESDTYTQKLILPTLKTAIDFYHDKKAFSYLSQALQTALENDNQLEEAFILTNKGFEYFRQGNASEAESCFIDSAKKLFNIRIHEISFPLNNLANCYMSRNMFEEAITILLRASLWNTSGYAFVTIQTLLMVCYAHIDKHEKSLQIANELNSYITLFGITDTTMLRKIYLNMAMVYQHLKEDELSINYALKAYPISKQTSSWYRAYNIVKHLFKDDKNPLLYCKNGEEWYWSNGCFEPWLITFSHD